MCVAIVIPESYKQALGLGHTKTSEVTHDSRGYEPQNDRHG